jgi:glycosyltransferase involved in cell wall biosynthesis
MRNGINIAFLVVKVSERGGISRVVSIITKELSKIENFNIHIISFQQRDVEGYNWCDELTFHNLLETDVSMKKGIFRAAPKIRKILDNYNIDILISCGELVGLLGVLSTFSKKTKLVYWSHTSFKAIQAVKLKSISNQITAFFSELVICLTKSDEGNYRKKTFARRIVQLYNPIDKQLENIRTTYDPKSNKIISVGRLTAVKNFELLVDVAKKVLEKHPEFSWHIFGSGERKENIAQKIIENRLEDKLILMGQHNNIYEIYNSYAMMVMTSRFEGFPMTLLEGMAFKLPLISFDIPTGPNEIIKNEINGYLIEPFDVDEMAKKICLLIENNSLRQEFSSNNLKLIGEFNLESIVDKWVSLIKNLAQ